MIKKSRDMRVEMRDRLRGGIGTLKCTHLMEKEESYNKLRMAAVFEIEPGQSIGLHPHHQEAEFYYLIAGTLVVNDNGVDKTLEAGDIMYTGNGESHGVVNSGDTKAIMLAVIIE